MASRTITATAPDGTEVSTTVGAKRQFGAVRILAAADWDGTSNSGWGGWAGKGERWVMTVHKTMDLAVTGANQSAAWNGGERWAMAVNSEGELTGEWVPAPK